MGDKPILFSAPMVRAILAGQKTVTRRILKDAPAGEGWHCDRTATGLRWVASAGAPSMPVRLRWEAGDKLWVKESWSDEHPLAIQEGRYSQPGRAGIPGPPPVDYRTIYRTDGEPLQIWRSHDGHPYFSRSGPADAAAAPYPDVSSNYARRDGCGIFWESARNMPRWASRITLSVTAVRVERLQDITEADAIAEGLFQQEGDGGAPGAGYKWTGTGYHGGTLDRHGGPCFHFPSPNGQCACRVGGPSPAQCAYRELWTHINGPGAWDANPWVVVIEFSREIANG